MLECYMLSFIGLSEFTGAKWCHMEWLIMLILVSNGSGKLCAIWHRAITWTNAGLPCIPIPEVISEEIFKTSITEMCL